MLKNVFHAPGGPARHLHYEQGEWFYVLESTFLFEVGPEHLTLQPGDSLLAPRRVPHVWAHVGAASGRIVIAFMPAGSMEAFFREVARRERLSPYQETLWHSPEQRLRTFSPCTPAQPVVGLTARGRG
ncbi:cupin domain-containing protein [Kallotenue papyrolyticum]|uniref:cupin domain-containing protein n=1 Tax=Kallotenue papyrolyticum TaxID=1325125 RepID=UPI003B831801